MLRIVVALVLSVLFQTASHAQPWQNPPEAPPPSRQDMINRFQQLTAAGAPFNVSAELYEEYLGLIQNLDYQDLWADLLEKKLNEPGNQEALDVKNWLALGEAHFKTGMHGTLKAAEAFQHALTLNPGHADALARLGQLHHREGQYDLAESKYRKALESDPENALALIGTAVLQIRKGDILNTSRTLDQLGVKAQPYDVETRLMLRQALTAFEHHGGWFDDTAENHNAYARLLYRSGRLTDAILAARRAVTLEPARSDIWNFIASMQLQIGNLEQAKQAYDQSLETNPDQPAIADTRRQLINTLTTSGPGKAP